MAVSLILPAFVKGFQGVVYPSCFCQGIPMCGFMYICIFSPFLIAAPFNVIVTLPSVTKDRAKFGPPVG